MEPYFTAEHDAANPSLILMKFDLSAIFGMEGSCIESCTLAPKQSTQTSPPFVLINIRHGLMNGNILAVRMAVLPTWTYRFSAACLVKVTGSCAAWGPGQSDAEEHVQHIAANFMQLMTHSQHHV